MRWRSWTTRAASFRLPEILGHARNYVSMNVLTKALGIVSLPVFTRLLTTREYGIVAVFQSSVAILVVVLSLNVHQSVGRYYFEETGDFDRYLGSLLFLFGLSAGVLGSLCLAFGSTVAGWLAIPVSLLPAVVALAVFEVVFTMYRATLVVRKESSRVAKLVVSRATVDLPLGIGLVAALPADRFVGRIMSRVAVAAAYGGYCLVRLLRRARFEPLFRHVSYALRYSLPLVPYTLSGVILGQFDRLMINRTLGAGAAGLYSLAYTIGMLVQVVVASLAPTVMPDVFGLMNRREFDKVDRINDAFQRVVLAFALPLAVLAPQVVMVLAAKKFHPAIPVVPVVVGGYVFLGMAAVYNRFLAYAKKTAFVSLAAVAAGILNIVLNAAFIPRYGYIAAAYTTLASYGVLLAAAWAASRLAGLAHVTSPWVLIRPLAMSVAVFAVAVLLPPRGWPQLVVVGWRVLMVILHSTVMGRSVLGLLRANEG